MLRIALFVALGYLVVGGDAQAAECRQADPVEWGACVSAEVTRLKPAMARAEKLVAASAGRALQASNKLGDVSAFRSLKALRDGTAGPQAAYGESGALMTCSLGSGCTVLPEPEIDKIVDAVGEPDLAGSLRSCLRDYAVRLKVDGCRGHWQSITGWAGNVQTLVSVAGDIPALVPGANDAYKFDLSHMRQAGLWPEPGVEASFVTPAYSAVGNGGQAYLSALKSYLDGRDQALVLQLHRDFADKPRMLY